MHHVFSSLGNPNLWIVFSLLDVPVYINFAYTSSWHIQNSNIVPSVLICLLSTLIIHYRWVQDILIIWSWRENMLKLHHYAPSCYVLQHLHGKGAICHYMSVIYFEICFLKLIHIADGFSILPISASFLFWFLIYLQRIQGCVILHMRSFIFNSCGAYYFFLSSTITNLSIMLCSGCSCCSGNKSIIP